MESGIKALEEYAWPGNVRQMQHLIERLTILAPNDRIDGEAVRDALAGDGAARTPVETLADAEARADPPGAGGHGRQQEPRGADSGHRAEDAVSQAGADEAVGAGVLSMELVGILFGGGFTLLVCYSLGRLCLSRIPAPRVMALPVGGAIFSLCVYALLLTGSVSIEAFPRAWRLRARFR